MFSIGCIGYCAQPVTCPDWWNDWRAFALQYAAMRSMLGHSLKLTKGSGNHVPSMGTMRVGG